MTVEEEQIVSSEDEQQHSLENSLEDYHEYQEQLSSDDQYSEPDQHPTYRKHSPGGEWRKKSNTHGSK